ncbi:hypothetical protein BS17DRAFT_57871 [Gyrodon lividus]|nr:hypothetical protein BS17DRAFT_57871 [Gyrodon lividus]
MLIRLVPPSPHPTVLYALTFPNVLPLPHLHPNATIPVAWASQLHLLTSILDLEHPSSIHMFDRAVGLVVRAQEVCLDVSQGEIRVSFVDGRVMKTAMNPDCVRMLLGVVDDVKACSEPEGHRSSLEGSACASIASSTEDLPPPGGSPTKSHKLGKHKRQRSLLFSLISSLVPRSLSSPSPPPPSPNVPTPPPPALLPPIPSISPHRVPPSISPRYTCFSSTQTDTDIIRRRARATLVDVWRLHVIPALSPHHMPLAGYIEWTLIGMAIKTRAEIQSSAAARSHRSEPAHRAAGGNKHRRTQSEGRQALDFGDHSEYERRRWRAPSPFPGQMDVEDTDDQVVYPRREQADEWGVRCPQPSGSLDELDEYAFEFSGYTESLLGEEFAFGNDWDDDSRFTFEFDGMGRHHTLNIDSRAPGFDDRHLHFNRDFDSDYSDDDSNRLADTAFDTSRSPLTPSDVNDDEDSDGSQASLRTPEEGDELPLATPVQSGVRSQQHSVPVSRVNSCPPRPRNASSASPSAPLTPSRLSSSSSEPARSSPAPPPSFRPSRPPALSTPRSSGANSGSRDPHVDELIASRVAFLGRICNALDLVRTRARDEGWRLVRATLIGAPTGWMDAEGERSLETKAKRRAWSAGIKISAPYISKVHYSSAFPSQAKVWDGSVPTLRSPARPPGLSSSIEKTAQALRPIVPIGFSLGVPVRSSPLAMYVWGADDGQKSIPNKYGALSPVRSMETMSGKRPSRVTFPESPTKLFPVCEEESEDLFEPFQVGGVNFPQAEPVVSVEKPAGDIEKGVVDGPEYNEDDPFYFSPFRPRTRTTSMYVISPTSAATSLPVLPMFRPRMPPPSYQATVGEGHSIAAGNEQRKLDPSALLCQPLSALCIPPPPSPQMPSPRPALTSNPPFVPRPRSVSLPTPKSSLSVNQGRHKDEHYEDLSQAYAAPPPDGPLVVSASPAPHERYPRYAHVHSPIPAPGKVVSASGLGGTGREVVFEQAGSEFTLGLEVALGRAEEGRVVW